MLARREITPTAAAAAVEFNDLGMHPMSSVQKKANKRRFTNEQIKFLESMYVSESRPESQAKQQLATQLGLQPRQVAIWFQNRRARLKTKHIEREYKIMKARYDALASDYESLKGENESLLTQLQQLQAKHQMSRNCQMSQTESSSNGRFETKSTDSQSKDKSSLISEGIEYGHKQGMHSRGNSKNVERTKKETDIFNLIECTDGSLTSSGWDSFESSCFLNESSCSSQWWELLS